MSQPNGLQRLPPFDPFCQNIPNLCHKPFLILRIPEPLRRKLCRAKIEVRAGKLRMLPHGVTRPDGLVPHDLGGLRALLEEFPLLEHPAVAVGLDVLPDDPSLRILLRTLHRDGISSRALQDHRIADLRLGKRLRHRAL